MLSSSEISGRNCQKEKKRKREMRGKKKEKVNESPTREESQCSFFFTRQSHTSDGGLRAARLQEAFTTNADSTAPDTLKVSMRVSHSSKRG